jgi:hypothetical protein
MKSGLSQGEEHGRYLQDRDDSYSCPSVVGKERRGTWTRASLATQLPIRVGGRGRGRGRWQGGKELPGLRRERPPAVTAARDGGSKANNLETCPSQGGGTSPSQILRHLRSETWRSGTLAYQGWMPGID